MIKFLSVNTGTISQQAKDLSLKAKSKDLITKAKAKYLSLKAKSKDLITEAKVEDLSLKDKAKAKYMPYCP